MEWFDTLISVFSDFVNPKKRVFLGYLALTVMIALLWLVLKRKQGFRSAVSKVFDRSIFFSRSSKADYKVFVINQLVAMLISPMLIAQITIATAVYYALHGQEVFALGVFSDTGQWLIVALFSVAMFVADDFTKYLLHRWMHHWPALWAFHKVHHSATSLTPVTVYRVHPLEGILFGLRSTLTQGPLIALFLFLFGSGVDLYTVVGVNVLVFIFHVTGSNLRHSNISIRYWGWLEHILISPAQHQLHHSVAEQHYDKNFGAALAVWDWLFGSLHLSEPEENGELAFGLEEADAAYEASLKTIYLGPVIEVAQLARKRVLRIGAWIAAKSGWSAATPRRKHGKRAAR